MNADVKAIRRCHKTQAMMVVDRMSDRRLKALHQVTHNIRYERGKRLWQVACNGVVG
jgi:hypothetical protein